MARYKLLVVDDELFVRELLEEYFSKMEFEVRVASSGPEALKIVAEHDFDVALVDLKMTDMDGLETLKKIHDLDEDLIMIIMTGYPTVESSVEALRAGAYDYVIKPFRLNELKDIVSRAVKEHQVRREISSLKLKIEAIERKLATLNKPAESSGNSLSGNPDSRIDSVDNVVDKQWNGPEIEAEDQIERWGKLLRDGFITRQEYEDRKRQILSTVC